MQVQRFPWYNTIVNFPWYKLKLTIVTMLTILNHYLSSAIDINFIHLTVLTARSHYDY